ncbi:MAG TPA: DNA-processing protein DprA [Candidatus Limnocylindria bacterium]
MIGVGRARPQAADRVDEELQPLMGSWQALDLASIDAEGDRPYWIAISLVPGVGAVGFARLLARFGSARAAWAAGDRLLDCLPRRPVDAVEGLARIRRRGATSVASQVEAAVRATGGVTLTALDPDYPAALRVTEPRPPVLYRAGEAAAFAGQAVAVVGTRRATGYGRAAAQEIADELGRAGVTVVSGLAIGIDGEAHAAALAAGGRSVAVLPSPLDRIYPPRHRQLAARLVAEGGALLSELAPGHNPGRPDFARRNRIIAALARATVVVEAPDHSGALLTAAAAVEMGRELYAVPGPIDSLASRGCNRLIADHLAAIVTSAAGLLTSIGLSSGAKPLGVETLSDPEGLVLYRLVNHPGSVEELLATTELSTAELASALTLLEARGLVTSYGGATFHPTLAARRLGNAR